MEQLEEGLQLITQFKNHEIKRRTIDVVFSYNSRSAMDIASMITWYLLITICKIYWPTTQVNVGAGIIIAMLFVPENPMGFMANKLFLFFVLCLFVCFVCLFVLLLLLLLLLLFCCCCFLGGSLGRLQEWCIRTQSVPFWRMQRAGHFRSKKKYFRNLPKHKCSSFFSFFLCCCCCCCCLVNVK